MPDRFLQAKTDGGLAFAESGSTDFESEISGDNMPTDDYESQSHIVCLDGNGSPVKAVLPNRVKSLSLYLPGVPEETLAADFRLKVPMVLFGASVAILGILLDAGVYTGLTGQTTVRASDAVYEAGGASNIDATLTNTGSGTDRTVYATGSIFIDTSSEYLYLHIHSSGDHADINVVIYFR